MADHLPTQNISLITHLSSSNIASHIKAHIHTQDYTEIPGNNV